jgi:cytochrome oxidase assembly protein ShyY1
MGSWQLDRFAARVESHQEYQHNKNVFAADRAAEPLDDLLPVTKLTSGRLATATGHYDAQFLVPGRQLDGKLGFYVLTLLRTEHGDALPVVRGWLPGSPRTAKIPAPPTGNVTVAGALQPSENRGSRGAQGDGGLPDGQIGIINAASLVNLVPYRVHDAWITLPDPPGALRPVPPSAPPGTGLDLKAFQNLGYTGEWFVFAGFVVFMWFRLCRQEVEVRRAPHKHLPAEEPHTDAAVPVMAPSGYGAPSDDARKDRTLKIAGTVLGASLLALIVWSGSAYISAHGINGELVTFKVISDEAVDVRLQVQKQASSTVVVCTLRSVSLTGEEVGRKDVRIKEPGQRVDAHVTLRTTQRSTAVELVGCQQERWLRHR